MADETEDPELFGSLIERLAAKFGQATHTNLNFQRRIKPHLKVSFIVLVKHSQETLLENRRNKRVGKHNNTIGRIRQGFHLLQTNLVEAARKDINGMSIF